jgi:MFS family permease
MIHLIYSPNWFYGKDIAIDVVSIIVLALIGFFSIKYYNIKKNKNYLYLALSFFLISLSFLFKIIMNFKIYYHEIETQKIGFLTITYNTIEVVDNTFIIGFLIYRILTIIGFYILYSLYQEQPKLTHILILYLIIVLTYFSQSAYYIFHLTLAILLTLIAIAYSKKYLDKKNITTKIFVVSIALIGLSQIFFMLVYFSTQLYVIAEFTQLAGYLGVLTTFIMVLKHGRKKNKN